MRRRRAVEVGACINSLKQLQRHAPRKPYDPHKTEPRHWGGVRTPILLIIPRLMWTLPGGQPRYRLLRHGIQYNAERTAVQETALHSVLPHTPECQNY